MAASTIGTVRVPTWLENALTIASFPDLDITKQSAPNTIIFACESSCVDPVGVPEVDDTVPCGSEIQPLRRIDFNLFTVSSWAVIADTVDAAEATIGTAIGGWLGGGTGGKDG